MKRLKFRLIGSPADYYAGEQRAYDVVSDGVTIGVVQADWLPHPSIPGETVSGFSFTASDGSRRSGCGRTRKAAVEDAYVVEQEIRR
jgi:hypothetical protein